MQPIITFGLALYASNPQKVDYLHQCIKSILNQTSENREIVISDDNSPIKVDLSQYLKDDRITYFRQDKNLGIFGNFNFCLNNANGKFFFPMGDDDMISADFVQKIEEIYNKNKDFQVVYFDHLNVDGEGKTFAYYGSSFKEGIIAGGKERLNNVIYNLFNGAPSVYYSVVDVQRLRELGGYEDNGTITDEYIMFLYSFHFNAYYIKKPLLYIRRHASNTSSAFNILKVLEERKMLIPKLLEQYGNNFTPKTQKLLNNMLENHYYGHMELLKIFVEEGRQKGLKKFIEIIKKKHFNLKILIVLFVGILFGKNSMKGFLGFAKIFNLLDKLKTKKNLPDKYRDTIFIDGILKKSDGNNE